MDIVQLSSDLQQIPISDFKVHVERQMCRDTTLRGSEALTQLAGHTAGRGLQHCFPSK